MGFLLSDIITVGDDIHSSFGDRILLGVVVGIDDDNGIIEVDRDVLQFINDFIYGVKKCKD